MDLQVASIPAAALTTVEALHAWTGMLLHRGNSSLKVLETQNFSDYACQASIFQAEDKSIRLVVRINLELQADYATSGKKIWESVKEFSEQSIPNDFKS